MPSNTAELQNWRERYDPTSQVPEWMPKRVADSWDAVNVINRMPHMFDPSMYGHGNAEAWPPAVAADIWGQQGSIGQRMSGLPPNRFTDIFASPSTQGLGNPVGTFGLPSNLLDLSQQPGLLDAIRKRIADAVAGVKPTTTTP
jgi:hypothetical protein